MNYDIDYFLQKFEAIDEDLWTVGWFTDERNPEAHCAFGHCGCTPANDETEEANALDRLFRAHGLRVTAVNDADESGNAGRFKQLDSPKARILAALESFK